MGFWLFGFGETVGKVGGVGRVVVVVVRLFVYLEFEIWDLVFGCYLGCHCYRGCLLLWRFFGYLTLFICFEYFNSDSCLLIPSSWFLFE